MAVVCNLSTLMGKKRYTIEDVHQRTGLSRSTVSNLYNDRATRVDYATIDKLCRLFSCGIDDLLGYCESPPIEEKSAVAITDSSVTE